MRISSPEISNLTGLLGVLAVTLCNGCFPQGRELVPMRWGLIPGWWKKAAKEMAANCHCA
jgi:hypothetical protein